MLLDVSYMYLIYTRTYRNNVLYMYFILQLTGCNVNLLSATRLPGFLLPISGILFFIFEGIQFSSRLVKCVLRSNLIGLLKRNNQSLKILHVDANKSPARNFFLSEKLRFQVFIVVQEYAINLK